MITLSELSSLRNRRAIERALVSRFDSDNDRFVAALDAGLNDLLRRDLRKAARFVEKAGVCFDWLPPRYRPRWLAMQGRYLHWSGNHRDSLKIYRKALKMFGELRDGLNCAMLRRGLMDVLMYLGRYEEAIDMGKRSLAYFRRRSLSIDAAKVMTNIGNVYHRTDRNRLALSYYDKARKLFEPQGGIPLAIVDYNRANIYTNLNDLESAETLYKSTARIYGRHQMDIARCQAEYSLAYVYFLRDRYAEALSLLERVSESFETLGDGRSAATVSLDLVELNNKLNLCTLAVSVGEGAITALQKFDMRYEEAKVNYFLGEARAKMGDFSNSSAQFYRAEKLFAREGNKLWLGMVNLGRARARLKQGRYKSALKSCRKAESLYRQCGDKRRIIDARLVITEALIENNDQRQATALLRRLNAEVLVGYQKLQWHYLSGRVHEGRSNLDLAIQQYEKAAEVLETMTSGLYPDEIRFFFVADKLEAHLRAAECLIRCNRPDQAFARQVRGLALLNQKGRQAVKQEKRLPAGLVERRQELRSALKKLQRVPRSAERGSVELSDYRNLENELWSVERRVRAHEFRSGPRTRVTPELEVNWRQKMVGGLGADDVLICFRADGGKLSAYCATHRGVEYVAINHDPEQMKQALRKLHFVSECSVAQHELEGQAASAVRHYLAQIHEVLIKPLERNLTGGRLIFLVDDIFAGIPFHGLSDENGICLGDRFKVRIIADPADIDRARRRPAFRKNAVFAVSTDSLPGVDCEADAISALHPGTPIYRSQAASCGKLFSELSKRSGFVHIAAHAARSSENPLFSRILMGDGPFFPFDLFGAGVKASLVTLSGCQTAAPGVYYGSSFSLAKSFYQAGARLVLASLWPVSDQLSRVFMEEFYSTLGVTGDVWQSHDAAISRLADLTKNPAFWCSFVLLGM